MNNEIARRDDAEDIFLDCAVEIAKTTDGREAHSELISLIATRYAESGRLDVAVDLAETISDLYTRDQTLGNIAASCVAAGAGDYADQLHEMIGDDNAYALAVEQMAVKYAEAGALEKSIEVAQRLADSAPALSRVALVSAVSGFFAQALEVARSIEYADLKAITLAELAAKALHEGRTTEALEILQEAAGAAEEIEFPRERISALAEISALYQESGQAEEAFETLSRARHLCDTHEDSMPSGVSKSLTRDEELAQVARGFAELQRYDQADLAIEEIEDPFQFAHATAMVALEHHKAGQSTEALALLEQALEMVRDEEVYGDHDLLAKEGVVDELARFYATVAHYDEALQITEMLNSQERRHRTLRTIAQLCVRSGNSDRAFRVAEAIEDNYVKVLCEVEIADAFAGTEQFESADHALSRAMTDSATIELAHEKASALMEIGLRFARREQVPRASEIFADALIHLAMIDDSYQQAHALINLAGKYAAAGQEPGENEARVLQEIVLKLG